MEKLSDEQLRKLLTETDIAEVMRAMMRTGNRYSRRILHFFQLFCKTVPPAIMVYHAYGIYEFSQHPREMLVYYPENEPCYLFIYFMMYVLPMVIILASRFFALCWRYRIPFFYLFGVNAIHIYFRSIFTTNEMVEPHSCLMVMIGFMYLYGLAEIFLNSKIGRRLWS